jgi:hypothetical protein
MHDQYAHRAAWIAAVSDLQEEMALALVRQRLAAGDDPGTADRPALAAADEANSLAEEEDLRAMPVCGLRLRERTRNPAS